MIARIARYPTSLFFCLRFRARSSAKVMVVSVIRILQRRRDETYPSYITQGKEKLGLGQHSTFA
jgi:hypothetical protein